MSEKKSAKKTSRTPAAASGSPMDVNLLEQIVKLMAANDLNTVEVQDGDRRITLKRGTEVQQVPVSLPAMAAPAAPVAAPAAAPTPAAAAAAPSEEAGLLPIKSPMVGTFYAAPNPESKPFVSVGSTVDEDTDVCIIEAMKVFNNIKAECRGAIAKVLVSNGQTVEFGQTLFLVKPS